MSLSALEAWTYWLTVAAIVLPILGGIAAILALVFSSQAAVIRDDALAKFQADSSAAIASAEARATQLQPVRLSVNNVRD